VVNDVAIAFASATVLAAAGIALFVGIRVFEIYGHQHVALGQSQYF
jgi:hypothetical protein